MDEIMGDNAMPHGHEPGLCDTGGDESSTLGQAQANFAQAQANRDLAEACRDTARAMRQTMQKQMRSLCARPPIR